MKMCVSAVCISLLLAGSTNAALLGHWAFDEGAGTTTLNLANPGVGDALLCRPTGPYEDITFTPLTDLWETDLYHKYVYLFEENYEFANVQADFTNITTNATTISAWVKRLGGNNAAEPIFGKAPTLYGMTVYDSWDPALPPAEQTKLGSVYGYVVSQNKGTGWDAIVMGEWTHVAMTFDGNVSGSDNLIIYINGAAVASKVLSSNIPDTTGLDFRIGGNRVDAVTRTYWNSSYFSGGVDDVRLYDNALTAAEIAELATPPDRLFNNGDANIDGVVDAEDATILAANWLSGPEATWGMGDFNEDGFVNDIDATLLAANWNAGASQSAVPEPGLVAMCLSAMAIFWLGRTLKQGIVV